MNNRKHNKRKKYNKERDYIQEFLDEYTYHIAEKLREVFFKYGTIEVQNMDELAMLLAIDNEDFRQYRLLYSLARLDRENKIYLNIQDGFYYIDYIPF